jgi:PAS domain S-box-containing protein
MAPVRTDLAKELEASTFQLNHRLLQMETLYEAGLVLSGVLDASSLQEDFVQLAVSSVDARAGFLILRDAEGGATSVVNVESGVRSLLPTLLKKELQQVSATAGPLNIGDLSSGTPWQSLLLVPVGDHGCLGVADKDGRDGVQASTETDAHLLEMLGRQAGMALTNASLFRAVSEERNLTANILDSVSSGVVCTDLRGRIVRANPVARRAFGMDEGCPGRNFLDDVATLSPEVAESVASTLKDGRLRRVERAALRGSDGILEGVVTSLRSEGTSMEGVVFAFQDLSERDRLERMFKQYASDQVVDMLLAGDRVPSLGGEVCEATVLFVDTVGSTEVLQRIGAGAMVQTLNETFTRLVDIVMRFQGTLDKFTGDGFMAVFGAPLTQDGDNRRAVDCALEILAAMDDLRAGSSNPIDIKVGLSRGAVVAGNVGSPRRMEYSVIGPDVVLASRLCDLAGPGQILVSARVNEELGDAPFPRELLGRHVFKGMGESMEVYRVCTPGAACVVPANAHRSSEDDRVVLDVPMATDMEVVVSQSAKAICQRLGFGPTATDEVGAALVEASINAFEHSRSKTGRLRIEFVPEDGGVTVVVTDQGAGFDVDEALGRVRQRRESGDRRRGWGLELIHEFMDRVDVESGPDGTTLTLWKRFDESRETGAN